MTERISADIRLKGTIDDVKKYPYSTIRSKNDVEFARIRSKKDGDNWRTFSRKLLTVNGWIFGPRISAVNLYRTYLVRNGERGCSREEIVHYLKEMKFSPEQIRELIIEVETSVNKEKGAVNSK